MFTSHHISSKVVELKMYTFIKCWCFVSVVYNYIYQIRMANFKILRTCDLLSKPIYRIRLKENLKQPLFLLPVEPIHLMSFFVFVLVSQQLFHVVWGCVSFSAGKKMRIWSDRRHPKTGFLLRGLSESNGQKAFEHYSTMQIKVDYWSRVLIRGGQHFLLIRSSAEYSILFWITE